MIKKVYLIVIFSCIYTYSIQAQFLWYENETDTENIIFSNTGNGTFSINETNPDTNGINTNEVTSKFVREADVTKGFSYFELSKNLLEDVTYTISLKAYVDIPTEDLTSINRIRFYIKNTTTGDLKAVQLKFSKGQEWEEFSFVFNEGDLPSEGFLEDGYNQVYIGYGNGQGSTSEVTYYIDQIYGSVLQEIVVPDPLEEDPLVDVLKGSWGGRFYVRGGEDLDEYVDNRGYDYIAGAQEIADSYPTMGHVITNGTNNANSHLWTLRTNPNVDAVMGATGSVVDEEFVPSLANEQIIIDVIDIFKKSGKKVILYINSLSPGDRASDEGAASWNNYVDTYFDGNNHEAWMNYCEGYIKRFTELGVDGYWFDTFGQYARNNSLGSAGVDTTDEEKNEFVEMIRNTAPNAIIANNKDKHQFLDEDGKLILVDTDGVNETVGIDYNDLAEGEDDDDIPFEEDERDYAIIKMQATNPWSDFTAGHITPLGQGAPPNSWAYEEFTVPDIEENHITIYEENSKQTLKHLFLPIRSTWSSERSDLMFDKEQAYRFAKRITDAGGSVTFSNTTSTDGTTSDDEVEILTYMDQQFAINADATVYQRPAGAFLVGEDHTLNTWSGFSDSTWLTASNWSKATVPVLTDNIIIPTGLTNYPTITTAVSVNSVSIENSASLLYNGGSLTTAEGVNYSIAVTDTNWHLVTSPVSGENYNDDWVTDNSIASGTTNSENRGIATYQNGTADNTTGNWVYMQGGTSATFGDGVGYSLLSNTGTGNFTFTGTANSSSMAPAISQNGTNFWNLIGNSYTSYLDVAAFIDENDTNFGGAFQAIYVWDDSSYLAKTTGYVYPGQAFFVSASATGTTASFTTAMQSHQNDITFLKSSNTETSIEINITDGTNNKTTTINYLDEKTLGLDPGFDIGMFDGVSSELSLYTQLVENNEGTAFAKQAVPNSDLETTIIPLGIKAAVSKEITFTAEALNLPSGLNVYLEDRQEKTYSRLDEANARYKVTLSESLNGSGRFYIHTSTNSVLSINSAILESIGIYKTNNSKLKITGLSQGKSIVKLFNILGKQMMETSFASSGSDAISLPNLAPGIYIIQLKTASGVLNKKIILE
ncbi:T9SS type A sorting domain-containing protein [Polaribacter sp. HaHaR_3_91]|uniref:T9SS type A sorting domain-containing protein n=1 Tax=Polaribacter sp. HaHaR_3_91 TaxID=2745561 RepID=UPI001C4F9E1A|nr:T9SS type A sorting domain-containing protein [Polaribacter sp. HaHaR_3_91]QXP63024.1 T9SS type A sorting domain-containing protein [Polaribacter sp. HaHaR_3_91]